MNRSKSTLLSSSYIFILLISILNIPACFSQEQELEKLLEEEQEYSDQSDLLELLSDLKQNPLDINTVTAQQLALLPWISPTLAFKIIEYRTRQGRFNDLLELLKIPGITPELYLNIRNYIYLKIEQPEKKIGFKFRSRAARKIEQSIGFKEGIYYNSPLKYYNLLRLHYKNTYRAGLLFEKDSGEKHFNDLALYYLQYHGAKNRFIVGNYRLELGQGLVFWNPYSYGKSAAPIYPAIKKERGLLSYSMVDENASLLGVASQICLKIYQLLIFYSNTKIDATIDSMGTVSSFYTAGYHRTLNELTKKDKLSEKLIGGRLIVTPNNRLKIGTTFYLSKYDKPLKHKDYERYRFAFNGDQNYVVSADMHFNYKNIFIFGEIAQSQSKGWGAILGVNYSFKPLKFLFLMRNYTADFHSLHGVGFGEKRGNPQNERGFYTGIRYKIFPRTKLLLYYDMFKYPWRTYFNEMPITGSDLLLQIEQKWTKKFLLIFRLKNKQKEKSVKSADYYNSILANEKRVNWRLQLEYLPISNLKLRFRAEKCNYNLNRHSKGLLLYQDIKYSFNKNAILYYRLTFFDTESYESRMYQFENDLPYVLTNQMLNGKGNRWYVCFLYKISTYARFSIKYAVTNYENIYAIGSGYDRINDNSLHTVSIQLESSF